MDQLNNPSPALIGAMQAPQAIINGYMNGNKEALTASDMMAALQKKQMENAIYSKAMLPLAIKPRLDLFKGAPIMNLELLKGLNSAAAAQAAPALALQSPKTDFGLGLTVSPKTATPSLGAKSDDEGEEEDDSSSSGDDEEAEADQPAPAAIGVDALSGSRAPASEPPANQPLTLNDLLDDNKFNELMKLQPGQKLVSDLDAKAIGEAYKNMSTNARSAAGNVVKANNGQLNYLKALAKIKEAQNKAPKRDVDGGQIVSDFNRRLLQARVNFEGKPALGDARKDFMLDPEGRAMADEAKRIYGALTDPHQKDLFLNLHKQLITGESSPPASPDYVVMTNPQGKAVKVRSDVVDQRKASGWKVGQ